MRSCPNGWKMFKRGTVTFDISRIQFNYIDFRNIKDFTTPPAVPAGHRAAVRFQRQVYQIYMSMFF